MNESKNFEGIPDDVKQEMLMLFETYSKNELINKLRSLRETPSKSPGKSIVQLGAHAESTSSGSFQSQLNFSDRIDTSNDSLANTYNQVNVSPQNSDRSPIHETKQQQFSETEKFHSVINSVTESDTLNFDCIKNNSFFNPVVLLEKIDLSNVNYETSLCKPPNDIYVDIPLENVGANDISTNVRKNRSRKFTNVKSDVLIKNFDNGSNVSSGIKPLGKCSGIMKKSMRLQCCKSKKDSELFNQGVSPKVLSTNNKTNIKFNSLKKCNSKKKLSKEGILNNVSPDDLPTTNSEIKIAFSKNLARKKSLEILTCDAHVSSDLKVFDPDSKCVEKKLLEKDDSESNSSSVILIGKKNTQNVKNSTATKKVNKRKLRQKKHDVKLTSNSEKQFLLMADLNEVNNLSLFSNDPIQASKSAESSENAHTELSSDDGVPAKSLRKRSISFNSDSVSSLKPRVLRSSSHSTSVDIKKQLLNHLYKENQSVFSNDPIQTSKSNESNENIPTESSSTDAVTASPLLKRSNRLKRDTVSSLELKVLRSSSCSIVADSKKQPFNNVHEKGQSVSPNNTIQDSISEESCKNAPTESSSDDEVIATSLRKMSNRSNSESVSSLKPKILKSLKPSNAAATKKQPFSTAHEKGQCVSPNTIQDSTSAESCKNAPTESSCEVTSTSLRKRSNRPNSETVSCLNPKVLRPFNCSTAADTKKQPFNNVQEKSQCVSLNVPIQASKSTEFNKNAQTESSFIDEVTAKSLRKKSNNSNAKIVTNLKPKVLIPSSGFTAADTKKQPLIKVHKESHCVSLNDPIQASKSDESSENDPSESNSNDYVSTTSLRKSVKLLNSETLSSLKPKVLRPVSCSTAADSKKQPLINVHKEIQYVSLNDPIQASKLDESSSDGGVTATSLGKGSNKSNNDTASSLKPKVLTPTCFSIASDTKKQPFYNVDKEDQLVSSNAESAVTATSPVMRSMLLRKISNRSNSETVSSLGQNVLKMKATSSIISNEGEKEKATQKSNLSAKMADAILTSRLRGKVENCGNSHEMQQNAEAYSKLSKMCSLQGLNLDDIFRRKEIKDMIEKYENNTEAIVFIGTHKCSTTGKIEPIVHVHRSKKVLLETIAVIQNKNNATSKVSK